MAAARVFISYSQKGRDALTAAALMVSAHTSYRVWQTEAYAPTAFQSHLPYLHLNRDDQKALVAKHIRDLARSTGNGSWPWWRTPNPAT